MAQGKKSFILYLDQRGIFDKLTDEQAGRLIKHIYAYCADENPGCDFVTDLAFESIKQALKRDLKKFESIKEKRSKAGKKSAEKRAQQNTTKSTHVESVEQKSTNPTVNDNENVNVNVNVNDSLNKEYSQNVLQTFDDCLKLFDDHLHPKTKKQSDNWKDTIEKLNRIEKIPFENILDIVRKTRDDPFWSKNFLSLTKLRKKDSDGVMYIVKFNEQIKSNAKNKRTNSSKQAVSDERLAEIYSKVFADKKE